MPARVYKNPCKEIPSRTRPSAPHPEELVYVIGESLFWEEPADAGVPTTVPQSRRSPRRQGPGMSTWRASWT